MNEGSASILSVLVDGLFHLTLYNGWTVNPLYILRDSGLKFRSLWCFSPELLEKTTLRI